MFWWLMFIFAQTAVDTAQSTKDISYRTFIRFRQNIGLFFALYVFETSLILR